MWAWPFSGNSARCEPVIVYPAIDLFGGKAVRLLRGDYNRMTVYSDRPIQVAEDFLAAGADHIHLVDLEGARTGVPGNSDAIADIIRSGPGFVQVGGGIRSLDTIERYLALGVSRVILGTAAVTDPAFLERALERHGEKIAVGVDLKDGFVAIKGWTETSALTADAFFAQMEALGVKTVICTDISRDGAMAGTNRPLYRGLASRYAMDLIASGGVSSLEDVAALRDMGLHGAILGKAYYTGAVDLKTAVEVAR